MAEKRSALMEKWLRESFTWTARLLAIGAVLLLGKANAAVAETHMDGGIYSAKDGVASDQMSYIQVGDLDENFPPAGNE